MHNISGNFPKYQPFVASIVKSAAGQTRDEAGEVVETGKLALRLEIVKGDNRFNIEILADQPVTEASRELNKDDYTPLTFFSLEGQSETVYVSKKDLEQRLHISMEKIKSLTPEELGQVIAEQVPYVAKAVDLIEETIKRKIFEIQTNLSSPDSPSRVVKRNKSQENEKNPQVPAYTELHARTLMKMAKLIVQDKNLLETKNRIYTFKNKKGVLKIYSINFENPIESGLYNTVYKISELSKDKPIAMKIPKPEEPKAIDDHKNLIAILRHLNKNPHPAIQKNPKIITVLSTGQICSLFTYLPADAYKIIQDKIFLKEFSPEEITTCFRNCSDALAYMIDMHVYHGDLKEENILVSLEPGSKRLIISDFGGSIYDRAESPQRPILGSHSAKITPQEDVKILFQAQHLFDKAVKFEAEYAAKYEGFKEWSEEIESDLKAKKNELYILEFDISYSEGLLFQEINDIKIQEEYEKQLERKKQLQEGIEKLNKQLEQCETLLSRDPQAERIERKREFLYLKERLQVFNLAHCFCCLMIGTSPLYSRKFYDFDIYGRPHWKADAEYSFQYYHDQIISNGGSEEFAQLLGEALDPDPLSEKRMSTREFHERLKSIAIFR